MLESYLIEKIPLYMLVHRCSPSAYCQMTQADCVADDTSPSIHLKNDPLSVRYPPLLLQLRAMHCALVAGRLYPVRERHQQDLLDSCGFRVL